MKSLIVFLLFSVAFSFDLQAQTMSQTFGNSVSFAPVAGRAGENITAQLTGGNAFQKQNIENNNNIGLPGYSSDGADADAYFSKDWAKGTVITTDHNMYDSGLFFMYNKISNNLYFRKEDSLTVMEADLDKIFSFSLITDKPHTFIRSDFINGADKGEFFEILLLNENKYSFFKSVKRVYDRPSASTAAMAITQTESSGHYEDKTSYFLYSNGNLKKVELKKKNFIDALGTGQDKAEAYINTHKGNFNEAYVIKMLEELN